MNVTIEQLIECTDVKFVKTFLSRGNNGINLLNKCCENGDLEHVKWLLSHDVDVNGICDNDYPLRQAVQYQHIEIIKFLLDNGANINLQNFNKGTALFNTMSKGCKNINIEIIKLLLDNGADVNLCNRYGISPLMRLCTSELANIDDKIEVMKLLLDKKADVNLQTSDKNTALIIICDNDDINPNDKVKIIKLLLENGVNVNLQNNQKWSALAYSVKYSNSRCSIEIIKLLLDNGAEINERSGCYAYTPLMVSSMYSNESSNIETVKFLIERGANINLMSDSQHTALSVACNQICYNTSNIETVKLLLDHGAKITPKCHTTNSKIKEILDSYKNKLYFGIFSKEKKEINYPGITEIHKNDMYYYVTLLKSAGNGAGIAMNWPVMVSLFTSLDSGEPLIYEL